MGAQEACVCGWDVRSTGALPHALPLDNSIDFRQAARKCRRNTPGASQTKLGYMSPWTTKDADGVSQELSKYAQPHADRFPLLLEVFRSTTNLVNK